MADFRRVVTALAVLALLTGFAVTANAQPTVNAFSCIAQAAVPPLLRAEGVTELVGDIVLNCSGGVPITTSGATIPVANFQVFVGNTTVTSRLISGSTSEALLLVDEPTTALNPSATFVGAGATGCSPCAVGGTIPNVYQGIVSGNSVTFIGVPVNPPGTTNTRIFRMTNIRINASAIGAGAGFSGSQVLAFTSISGSTSIPVNNPQQVVGFVQQGMAFSVRNAANDDSSSGLKKLQCEDLSKTSGRLNLRYTEGFATAFKTQVSTAPAQILPGAIYNTESGLVIGSLVAAPTGVTTYTSAIGLADFGTRLKATFRNIPTGISIYVGTNSINPSSSAAVLVATESTVNATPNTPFVLTKTDTISSLGAYKLPVDSTGTAVAVWEVQVANTLATENYDFPIWFSYTGNAGNNSPPQGVQGTVSGAFAPTSTTSSASSTAPVPRFVDLSTPKNVIIVNLCRTSLLYPFVTAANGFDTGLAIANTTSDGGTTTPQSGTCTLNFFGDNAPSAYTTPTAVAGGTVWVNVASVIAPSFQGYVIARCNFQYAHGFAFVQSTVGYNPSSTAMGYLALVLTRLDAGESLGM